ncbi:hypothetical protein EVAR_79693_1 [Eumeta japonica]|uniref:Uncharacterized protein n=1 Tax=Eumeta variegata TaxID=151549 RepID=A0A4C1T996_EUMVA|nr:hypothetical protein EVAR_79693_1 [Eumeta japonica]
MKCLDTFISDRGLLAQGVANHIPHASSAANYRRAEPFTASDCFWRWSTMQGYYLNWFVEFKRGRVNLCDEYRDGHPPTVTAVTNKNIDAAHHMIETDRHMFYHEIGASLRIGMSQIQSVCACVRVCV